MADPHALELEEVIGAMTRVLIIDDDEMFSEMLAIKVQELGHHTFTAQTMAQGSQLTSQQPFDVVFLDVRLPDGNGLDLLPRIKQIPLAPEVIIITGVGDADGAELAIKSGAWDYVEKGSFSLKEMTLILNRALQYRQEKTASKDASGPQARGHHRQESAHAGLLRSAGPGRLQRGQRADHRRDRHRKRAFRPGGAPEQQPGQGPLRGGGLRRHPG
jgi:DNA-binding NtrC family response regulator